MYRSRAWIRLLPTLLAVLPAVTAAGSLDAAATPGSGGGILVSWAFTETPGAPVVRPEWVGYDVVRRAEGSCEAAVRLNADIVPRVVGRTHTGEWLDGTASSGVTYAYRVLPVDASRRVVLLDFLECDPLCSEPAYACWPALSAPLVVGTVSDWGWAVQVTDCSGACGDAFYVQNPAAEALRPYAGTSQAVRVWGTATCGTTEGCALHLDHVVPGTCGVTPARRPSWGALKTHYH